MTGLGLGTALFIAQILLIPAALGLMAGGADVSAEAQAYVAARFWGHPLRSRYLRCSAGCWGSGEQAPPCSSRSQWTRSRRTATRNSTAAYIANDIALRPYGVTGIWSALLASYLYRAGALAAFLPHLRRSIAPEPARA